MGEARQSRNTKGHGGVTPHGTKGQWRARINLNGKKLSKVCSNRNEALNQIRLWQNGNEAGTLIVGTKSTLIEIIDRWLEVEEAYRVDPKRTEDDDDALAESTLQGYTQKVDAYIRYAPVAHISLSALTGDDISAFIKSLGNGTFAKAKTAAIEKQLAALKITDPLIGQKRRQLAAQRPRTSSFRYSTSIQRQTYAVIRDGLRWAVAEKLVTRNVAHDYKAPGAKTNSQRDAGKPGAIDRKHGYELDRDTLFKIIDTLDKPRHVRLKARWLLSLRCGLRPGEALGLCFSDVDFRNRVLWINRQVQPKTGKGTIIVARTKTEHGHRSIMLDDEILALLKQMRHDRRREARRDGWEQYEFEGTPYDLIFTQVNGKIISQRLDAEYWRRLLSDAGVPHVRRYVARHTAASQMMAKPNADPVTVAAVMGHSDPAFTMKRYSHALDEKKRALAEQMAASGMEAVFNWKESLELEHGREWMIEQGITPNQWTSDGELVS